MSNQPKPNEYATFYHNYIQKIGGGEVIEVLTELKDTTYQLFIGLSPDKADYAYAEGKWTIKQLLGHMIDAERTFAYRILAFSRGQEELPGFDENMYVERSNFNSRTLQSLADEFKATREANLYLYRALTPEQIAASGIANGAPITVNALLYIAAGHELHHISIIKERYL